MIELVVPDALDDHTALDDDRLSVIRELAGRQVFAFEGPLDEAQALANTLSADAPAPVLVNNVTDRGGDTRTVDVHMHQDGRPQSVSAGVEQPHPDS